jgi:hypothetical protein
VSKPSDWSTAADLRAQVQRLWDRGDLLRDLASSALSWPLRLSLKSPSAADLTDRFEAVRNWVGALSDMPSVRVEWRDWHHRVQGTQRLPAAVWVDTLEDALALLAKVRSARRFQDLWERTASAQPTLLAWLSKRPLQALEIADRWGRLMAVVSWLQTHPRPGIYLRQVDVPGIDSKFIEAHRGVLTEWLDLALPPADVATDARGVAQFARRYGFRDKPDRIRFRPLDARLLSLPGSRGLADITVDAQSFAALDWATEHVFITENEVNFLAFPTVDRAVVVFGAGYGWDALAEALWLNQCSIHYWGDIDTHGFAILDQLRGHFPGVRSLLMDRETLLVHRDHWGEEPEPTRRDLSRLSNEESELYDELRSDRLQVRLRLEQERVSFGWLLRRLGASAGIR